MSDRIRTEQARLIEATISPINLYRGCEHVLNDTTCDVMCEAYVRGDGMLPAEPTDRICWKHGATEYDETECWAHDIFNLQDDCVWGNVVRVTP